MTCPQCGCRAPRCLYPKLAIGGGVAAPDASNNERHVLTALVGETDALPAEVGRRSVGLAPRTIARLGTGQALQLTRGECATRGRSRSGQESWHCRSMQLVPPVQTFPQEPQ